MRHLQAVVLALASAAVGCCGLPGWLGGRHHPTGPAGDPQPVVEARRPADASARQAVLLDVALVERPRGDAFLEGELWELGNEQGVDLETKPLLEENGLRVGQIGGILPARLQALVTSPHSCPEPTRRLRADAEQGTQVQVGGSRARLTFAVQQGADRRAVELANAVCFLDVTPTPDGERRVRLRFTPRVRHGKAAFQPRVARDPGGALRWDVEAREPVEEFPALSWELTVGPDEYVLIGPRLDRPDTLGAAYFLGQSERGPVQKLLVLRAVPLADPSPDDTLQGAPPLALQASWTPPASRRK